MPIEGRSGGMRAGDKEERVSDMGLLLGVAHSCITDMSKASSGLSSDVCTASMEYL